MFTAANKHDILSFTRWVYKKREFDDGSYQDKNICPQFSYSKVVCDYILNIIY